MAKAPEYERGASYVKGHEIFGEAPERYWQPDEIEAFLREDHPDWPEAKVRQTAFVVSASLHRDILDWKNCQRRYHRHVVPQELHLGELEGHDQLDDVR